MGFTILGGSFLLASVTYTIMFAISPETFGIPADGTRNDDLVEIYLNPGLLGLTVAAPSLAVGITKLVKGNIKYSKAKSHLSHINIHPYFAIDRKTRSCRTGLKISL
jgi:hypothetical protein